MVLADTQYYILKCSKKTSSGYWVKFYLCLKINVFPPGEGEFNQRMERFKVPVFQASPVPTMSPANPYPRTRSNFVSGIQQKLHGTTTPSSKQASRMRQVGSGAFIPEMH